MIRFFQALRIAVVLAVVAVASVPLLVAVDLMGGGDGWGLCPNRLRNCRTSYFDGPELAALLAIALFVLVAASRLLTLIIRYLQRRKERAERRAAALRPAVPTGPARPARPASPSRPPRRARSAPPARPAPRA